MNKEKMIFHSLEVIEKRISEKLTVEHIASSVYFSKYHYQRLFHEIVGDSVMEYITKRKLTLAGKALLETNATILEIALKYGYDSHEGFTRSFKAYMGITPSDYRKYGLTAISQKSIKERIIMGISKNTNELVRELNCFIVKAKKIAEDARKNELLAYKTFWDMIANRTDFLVEKLKDVLDSITTMEDHPDEITSRFTIMKVIEETAFELNHLALHVNLMILRGQPQDIKAQTSLCEKYTELAQASLLKVDRIIDFFRELSSLIFQDMRKSATDKIADLIQKGKEAENNIVGYSYIKEELHMITHELSSTPVTEITIAQLENFLNKLEIILFAVDMDTYRCPDHKTIFKDLPILKENLLSCIDFFHTLIKIEDSSIQDHTSYNHLIQFSTQGNLLFFYIKGELSLEKLGKLLTIEQRKEFDHICSKINDLLQVLLYASTKTEYTKLANTLYDIYSDLISQADKLGQNNGVILFLANEFKHLASNIENL